MKNKHQEVLELEAELLRLNTLVRNRRAQLKKLETCPHKDCECRAVWQEQVDRTLSRQMGKIRRQVGSKAARNGKAAKAPQPARPAKAGKARPARRD